MRIGFISINAQSTALATYVLSLLSLASQAPAQEVEPLLIEPIHRVTHEQPAEETTHVATRIAPKVPQSPLNLEKLDPTEHPLMPALRMAKGSLQLIDQNIQDYSAILYKQERIGGTLHDEEVAYIKVRHQPFSVYMYFLKPHKGRECLYVDPENGEKGILHARDCGMLRKLGKFELDPDGPLAMKGQKYPITKIGIRNLTTELVDVATNDIQFGECEVTSSQRTLQKRPVTVLDVIHPTPRRNFRYHRAQLFIDNQLRMPTRYVAYLWPSETENTPPLEESYTYTNLKINNGFTDLDFDPENPEYFKK